MEITQGPPQPVKTSSGRKYMKQFKIIIYKFQKNKNKPKEVLYQLDIKGLGSDT
jgi:hypothetical protein